MTNPKFFIKGLKVIQIQWLSSGDLILFLDAQGEETFQIYDIIPSGSYGWIFYTGTILKSKSLEYYHKFEKSNTQTIKEINP